MRPVYLAASLLFVSVATLHAQPAPAPTQPESPPIAPAPEHDPTDSPQLRPAHKPREIVIDIPGERSTPNKIALGATLGAGVIAGAIGLYFNLDSRAAANDVEAVTFDGEAWTQEEVDLVERADRSRTRAIVGYSIGSAFVIGAIIAFIVTDPKSERAVIRTGASATLVPGDGGAMALGTWSF